MIDEAKPRPDDIRLVIRDGRGAEVVIYTKPGKTAYATAAGAAALLGFHWGVDRLVLVENGNVLSDDMRIMQDADLDLVHVGTAV